MKSFLHIWLPLVIALVMIFNFDEVKAQYQGPESGSITGGAFASTDNFSLLNEYGPFEPQSPKRKLRLHKVKLLPDPPNMIEPTGPAGSNEIYDISTLPPETNAPIKVIGFEGIPDQGTSIPPDPHMAAGPNHLMAVVNSRFGIFDKSGNVLKLIEADAWYANVARGVDPFDPQIVYDHHSDRWVMIWIEYAEQPPRASLLLSVSDDSDPLGTWCNWRIPSNQNGSTPNTFFNDYPKIGVDENALYVTANMYDIVAGGFQYAQIRVIPKAQLLDNTCGPVTWNDFWDIRDPSNDDTKLRTIIPCVTFGSPGTEYLISDSPYQTGTFMTLWHLIDPIGNPLLIGINIPVTESMGRPSDADQLGGSTTLIDVGGRAVRNAVYMDGSVWTSHSIPGGENFDYAFARYVRVDVNTSVAVEDLSFGAKGYWYYYPAIHPDAYGNMVMVFTRSGLTEYAAVRYTGRMSYDPPGLQSSSLLKAGERNYMKTFSGTRNRWGDYNGIALDPVDGSKVWMFAEYADSPINTWGTWFGQVTYTPLPGKVIRYEPASIAYGTYEVGQASTALDVVISNIGAENLTVSSITNSTPSFQIDGIPNLPVTLSSFEEIELTAKFTPIEPGALSDTIRIMSNDTSKPLSVIALTGYALGTATFSGIVKDSLLNQPVKATLTFLRQGEDVPRAIVDTDNAGAFSAVILEGTYDITVVPEIPYPEVMFTDYVHTLAGTQQDLLLLPAAIVLVEDDSTGIAGENLRRIFNELGYQYAVWNMNENHTSVPAENLKLLAEPGILFWATGTTKTNVLSQIDRENIINHLKNGNSLILTGDNIAETSPINDSLLTKYLGVEFGENYPGLLMKGFVNDPIGNGLVTGAVGESKDQLLLSAEPLAQVSKIFHYGLTPGDSARISGVRVFHEATDWKAVFCGFRLEEVTQLNRKTVIKRIVDWISETQVKVIAQQDIKMPQVLHLEQNYPNPFNPTTTIAYDLPAASLVSLKVYNLVGQEVATLVNKRQIAGRYNVLFNAKALPNGVYMYQLRAVNEVKTKKLIFLK